MTMPPPRGTENGRLDSWKAIAAYLRHDVSTVMRWEKTSRLPVRRVPGRRRGSVFAFTVEIDRWLQGVRDADGSVSELAHEAIAGPAPVVQLAHAKWSWRPIAALGVGGLFVAFATGAIVQPLNEVVARKSSIQASLSWQTTANGRLLFATGASKALGGAVFSVLSADPAASSHGPSLCVGCPSTQPLAYFVVPWSDVANPESSPLASLSVDSSGGAELRALQGAQPAVSTHPAVIVTLDGKFDVVRRVVNSDFWIRHAELERQGRLTHPAERCPWRTAPPVRRWLPRTGWQDIK